MEDCCGQQWGQNRGYGGPVVREGFLEVVLPGLPWRLPARLPTQRAGTCLPPLWLPYVPAQPPACSEFHNILAFQVDGGTASGSSNMWGHLPLKC